MSLNNKTHKTSSLMSLFSFITILFLFSCKNGDSSKNEIKQTDHTDRAAVTELSAEEQPLSKISTGQTILDYKKKLISEGYSIKIIMASPDQILKMNGHPGAAYTLNDKSIVIYISSEFDLNTKAHAIAHELFHVKDDLEIQNYLKDYPYVNAAAEKFVKDWKAAGKKITKNSTADKKVMDYVLGTLFCAEARAYNFNKSLMVQGLKTDAFSNVKSFSRFLDKTYIAPFGTTYGKQAKPMLQKCLGFADMTAIQSEFIWSEESK